MVKMRCAGVEVAACGLVCREVQTCPPKPRGLPCVWCVPGLCHVLDEEECLGLQPVLHLHQRQPIWNIPWLSHNPWCGVCAFCSGTGPHLLPCLQQMGASCFTHNGRQGTSRRKGARDQEGKRERKRKLATQPSMTTAEQCSSRPTD